MAGTSNKRARRVIMLISTLMGQWFEEKREEGGKGQGFIYGQRDDCGRLYMQLSDAQRLRVERIALYKCAMTTAQG